MRREIGKLRALANAALVLAVLALAGFGVLQVARRQWRWQETFAARAAFPTIAGVELGDRVRLQGIDAGVVESITPPSRPGEPVTLTLRLDARLRPLVRVDAVARIATEGVVGSKVVELLPGTPDAPPLAAGGLLRAEPPLEVADLLRQASDSLKRVDAATRTAESGIAEVTAIAASIRRGEGSLGRLVRDDEAYERIVALSDRGEQTLDDLGDNLAALKQTWPLSLYFRRRGFEDRDLILFRPGAERESRVLREADLFEPGRAVLTAPGRKTLDEVAAWFKRLKRPGSTEIVIAAFTDDDRGPEVAQALTQQQADAVRLYLISRHKLDALDWFRTRKVAAVGFGTEAPRALADAGESPARRVEIILFTPQT